MTDINDIDYEYNKEAYGFTEELTEDNFYVPAEAEYEDFGEPEEEWDIAEAKPGLWENIRKKKEREGKKMHVRRLGKHKRKSKWKRKQQDRKLTMEGIKKKSWRAKEKILRAKRNRKRKK